MAVPKSVVKINKDGVTYTSSVDRVCYTITELTRAALRDVGRFIIYNVNQKARKLPGMSKKWSRVNAKFDKDKKSPAFQYQVMAKESPIRLAVGTKSDTWYGAEQELGSSKMKRHGFLTDTTRDNIQKIVEIESQYLSSLEDEAKALSLIPEDGSDEGGEE